MISLKQLIWYNVTISAGIFWYVWGQTNFWTGILYFCFWEVAVGYKIASWVWS